MQHSDERPPTSGRPSLLSLDQQAEADRHRILSGLESKPAAASAGGGNGRKSFVTWIVAGAAVLALGAGAAMWLVSEGEKEIVLAGTAPLPATPAPAAELASDGPVMRGTAEDVPAAAILEDTPVITQEPEPVAAGEKQADDELTKMLEQGMPEGQADAGAVAPLPMVTGKEAVKTAAAAKPARAVKRTVAKARPKKRVVPAREEASNVAPRPRKKKETKAAAPVDRDVALLAALVAHSKATQPKSTGTAAKLRQCKSLASVAEANQCRARVCASAKNEPACK